MTLFQYSQVQLREWSAVFQQQGWLQIHDLLPSDLAETLYQVIDKWREWNLVTRLAGVHREFDGLAMNDVEPAIQKEFKYHLYQEVRSGFQYLYERYPLYDLGMRGTLSPNFQQIFQLIRSPAYLALLKEISGITELRFTDGQITRYRPGHFLTSHDDQDEQAGRRLAFVLNLTKDWDPDYGGLLQFFDKQRNVSHARLPRFNTLTIFRVPQLHAVSYVAPFATGSRYAVTGWARAGLEQYLNHSEPGKNG